MSLVEERVCDRKVLKLLRAMWRPKGDDQITRHGGGEAARSAAAQEEGADLFFAASLLVAGRRAGWRAMSSASCSWSWGRLESWR